MIGHKENGRSLAGGGPGEDWPLLRSRLSISAVSACLGKCSSCLNAGRVVLHPRCSASSLTSSSEHGRPSTAVRIRSAPPVTKRHAAPDLARLLADRMLIRSERPRQKGHAARGSGVVSILETYNMPFAAALVLMAMLAVIQMIGLADLFGDHDVAMHDAGHADVNASNGLMDGLFSLIGLGRLPLMVWLPVALGLFAGLGVSIQALAANLLGTPLDRWVAAATTDTKTDLGNPLPSGS
jgi:hypothetical protein